MFYYEEADRKWCPHCKRWVIPNEQTEYQGEHPHGGYVNYEMCPGCGEEDLMESEPDDDAEEEADDESD